MIAMEKKKISSSSGRWACPRGVQGMQVAGSRWVIGMGDAGKVSSLWTQTLGWTWPGVSQKAPRGQGSYRRRGRGSESRGGAAVPVETLNGHVEKEPRPWTARGPHLGQVGRQSPGGGT